MKNLIFISLFLTCVFSGKLFSQQAWFWENPFTTSNNFRALSIVDSNTVYAAGDAGTLIKTTNGGQDWTLQSNGTNTDYYAVFFINANTGWVSGYKGNNCIIRKTTNSGINWQSEFSDTSCILQSIFFIDSQTGWAGGGYYSNTSTMLKTTNGGLNWVRKNTGTQTWFYCVNFLSPLIGWASGSVSPYSAASIIKTTDGGESWSNIGPSNTYNNYSVDFINQSTGWTCNSANSIQKTTDGGLNWVTQTTAYANSIKFFNADSGAAFGTNKLYLTTNGGVNWSNTQSPYIESIYSASMFNMNCGWVAGWYGQIIKITDGINWSSQRTTNPAGNINDIYFANSLTGWAATDDPINYNMGSIYCSTDGGVSWNQQYYLNVVFRSFSFISSQTGWAVGSSNANPSMVKVLGTTNSGTDWNVLAVFTYNNGPVKALMQNAQTGYVLFTGEYSGGGVIAKTTNGGINWTSPSGSGSSLTDIGFFDANTGICIGGGGNELRTTNGGSNWFYGYTGAQFGLTSLCITNSTTAFATGTSGMIKTTNAGISWDFVQDANGYDLRSMAFLNSNAAWACGWTGNMLYTTNGGTNWNYFAPLTGNLLAKVFFVNENTGWISGGPGTLIKTTNGGNILSANLRTVETPISFRLSQNYPNPFNPSTTIKFDIPTLKGGSTYGARGMTTRLSIYDILGREIATLINKQLQPGSYSVDWDASNFPSGVYFYKLEAGDPSTGSGQVFSESKKMVLIK